MMGETFFRFEATELISLRIVCKHCGTIMDVKLDRLVAPVSIQCICGRPLQAAGRGNLTGIALALMALAHDQNASVEFSLPVKP